MHPETVYHFFHKLRNDVSSLIYMGEFDNELTSTLMHMNEASVKESRNVRKKLSFLIAECFQNIIHHADKPDILNRTNNKPRMFSVRNTGSSYAITSTNLIYNDKKEDLTIKLKSITSASKDELKTAYVNALGADDLSEGKGLGLIEIARESESKMEFDFELVNYFFSVFYMQVHIKAISVSDKIRNKTISLANTKELYAELLKHSILMIRKGDFSQESILPLLELIENNLNSQGKMSGKGKKILYLLVELLQNISKHAYEHNDFREGIFIVALDGNRYVFNTGNYIRRSDVGPLKEKLEDMIRSDKDKLSNIYKESLLRKDVISSKGAGIGLIEISRFSTEKLKYSFTTVTHELSFFSLSITF